MCVIDSVNRETQLNPSKQLLFTLIDAGKSEFAQLQSGKLHSLSHSTNMCPRDLIIHRINEQIKCTCHNLLCDVKCQLANAVTRGGQLPREVCQLN